MKRFYALLVFCLALPACFARTVTDELGRTVTVPRHPHRLICLMPSVTDDVYALGAGADIVAVTDFTNYPPEAQTKRRVGTPQTPSIKAIVALHPDLVLGDAEFGRAETTEQLQKLGIAVFMVAPHGVEGIYRSITSLGDALNRSQAAKELVSRLRAREAAVRQRVSGQPVVSLLMPMAIDPIITIGEHSFLTELIEIAGGRSVTSDLPQEWVQVSLEAVLARAPQALLLVRGSKMSTEEIRERPDWVNVPAVRNNRIYYTDERFELPSPVAFDALDELAKQLHP